MLFANRNFFWRQICIELSSKIGNQLFFFVCDLNSTIHTNTNAVSIDLIMIKEDIISNKLFVIYNINEVEDNARQRFYDQSTKNNQFLMHVQNLLKINHQRIPTSIKAISPFKSENTNQ